MFEAHKLLSGKESGSETLYGNHQTLRNMLSGDTIRNYSVKQAFGYDMWEWNSSNDGLYQGIKYYCDNGAELLEKYPNCKIALQWWCNAYYSPENGVVQMSQFSINRNKWLKEFMVANPPDFKISNKCCEYAKKKPAKLLIKKYDADLEIIGVRKAEGGIRSASYKTCFSESKTKGCNSYRPVFWYTDGDKRDYEEMFGVTHSRCYTEYGLRRTGCVGCPFSKHITEELAIIEEHEPNLYKAAVHIFGKSYEYTAKYRAFVKEMKAKEKEEKKRDRLRSLNGTSACDTGGDSGSCTSDRNAVSADYNAPEIRKGA